MRDDIEAHTDFRYELYKNAALLTISERQHVYTLFPNQKGISDIILHFAAVVRAHLDNYPPDEYGQIRVTMPEFHQLLNRCMEQYGEGWSKTYREMTLAQLSSELLSALKEWKMAEHEQETGMVTLYPLLGRLVGRYSDDFLMKGRDDDDE
ncbi:hypothetical protein LR68_03031 [Anoxybacillus sp. BCO1]|nr:hypothetical protein LR68_03031 [Anoxybacillus sp. BCO1]